MVATETRANLAKQTRRMAGLFGTPATSLFGATAAPAFGAAFGAVPAVRTRSRALLNQGRWSMGGRRITLQRLRTVGAFRSCTQHASLVLACDLVDPFPLNCNSNGSCRPPALCSVPQRRRVPPPRLGSGPPLLPPPPLSELQQLARPPSVPPLVPSPPPPHRPRSAPALQPLVLVRPPPRCPNPS